MKGRTEWSKKYRGKYILPVVAPDQLHGVFSLTDFPLGLTCIARARIAKRQNYSAKPLYIWHLHILWVYRREWHAWLELKNYVALHISSSFRFFFSLYGLTKIRTMLSSNKLIFQTQNLKQYRMKHCQKKVEFHQWSCSLLWWTPPILMYVFVSTENALGRDQTCISAPPVILYGHSL